MKAVIVRDFKTIHDAVVSDCADPVPAQGEVVVDLHAVDVNYPDILYLEGKYQAKPSLPFSPGLGGAGRVAALGDGVANLAIGQKVLVLPSWGTYAEKVAAPALFCFPMPEKMPFDIGAALGLVYQTAFFSLVDRGGLREGDHVLVLGAAGGIGMAAVQLAKALGARTVTAATRGEDGAAFARRQGADAVMDAGDTNIHEHLRTVVMDVTGGHGADIVVDPVGGPLSAAAMRAIAWSGQLVVVGFASGDIPKISANYLLVKNIAACGIQWTDYRARQPERVQAVQQKIFEWWTQGRLSPEITGRWPLESYADALTTLARSRAKGKLILNARKVERGTE